MWMWNGFKTKEEAKEFAKTKEHSRIVWEKNEVEPKGHLADDYQVCVLNGMPRENLYAVIWKM